VRRAGARRREETRGDASRGEQSRAEQSRGEERRGEERRGEERRYLHGWAPPFVSVMTRISGFYAGCERKVGQKISRPK
jgi:hypothetical protein